MSSEKIIEQKEEFICNICGKVFLSEDKLMEHFKDNHTRKRAINKEQIVTEQLLKSKFANYDISIIDGKKSKCSYFITLTDTKTGVKIEQKFGESLDDSCMYQNPTTEEKLIKVLNEKIETLKAIKKELSKNSQLEYLTDMKFLYGDFERKDGYHFKMGIKDRDTVIEEVYFHNLEDLKTYIEYCNRHFSSKLEGEVIISNKWGLQYYINGINIEGIMALAHKLNKRVRLEII